MPRAHAPSHDFCPYVTSDRGFPEQPLNSSRTFAEVQRVMNAPGNGVGDIYRTSLPALLEWARQN